MQIIHTRNKHLCFSQ